jgi:hypothetical protein
MVSTVTVDARWYENGHGKQPKGEGHWLFQIGAQLFSYAGYYGDCREHAVQAARDMGIERIEVLS